VPVKNLKSPTKDPRRSSPSSGACGLGSGYADLSWSLAVAPNDGDGASPVRGQTSRSTSAARLAERICGAERSERSVTQFGTAVQPALWLCRASMEFVHAGKSPTDLKRIDIVKSGHQWVAKSERDRLASAATRQEVVRAAAQAARIDSDGVSVRIHKLNSRPQAESPHRACRSACSNGLGRMHHVQAKRVVSAAIIGLKSRPFDRAAAIARTREKPQP
jgi:hypothetical protein